MPANPTINLAAGFPLPDGDNELKSWAYLANVIKNLLITNVDQTNINTAIETLAAVGSTAPSAPTTGRLWVDTSQSTYQLKFWSGSAWVAVWAWGPTAPTTTQNTPWYDSTHNLTRVYGTRFGITGWHPIDSSYALMTNREGSTVAANLVVVRNTTTSDTPEFELPRTPPKDPNVVGVTLESIDNGSAGLVVVAEGGSGVVQVTVDQTPGTVAKGDLLVTYDGSGKARTVGPRPSSSGPDRELGWGTPFGAFAVAIGVADGSSKVWCKMLGAIGEGAYQSRDPVSSTELIPGPNFQDLTFTGHVNPKHKPMIMVKAKFRFQMNISTGDHGSLEIADRAAAASPSSSWVVFTITDNLTVQAQEQEHFTLEIPTHDTGNPTSFPGDSWTYRVQDAGGQQYVWTTYTNIGYWY